MPYLITIQTKNEYSFHYTSMEKPYCPTHVHKTSSYTKTQIPIVFPPSKTRSYRIQDQAIT